MDISIQLDTTAQREAKRTKRKMVLIMIATQFCGVHDFTPGCKKSEGRVFLKPGPAQLRLALTLETARYKNSPRKLRCEYKVQLSENPGRAYKS